MKRNYTIPLLKQCLDLHLVSKIMSGDFDWESVFGKRDTGYYLTSCEICIKEGCFFELSTRLNVIRQCLHCICDNMSIDSGDFYEWIGADDIGAKHKGLYAFHGRDPDINQKDLGNECVSSLIADISMIERNIELISEHLLKAKRDDGKDL